MPAADGAGHQLGVRKLRAEDSYRDAFLVKNVLESLDCTSTNAVRFILSRYPSPKWMSLQLKTDLQDIERSYTEPFCCLAPLLFRSINR